jgi:hypothetical protein
VSFNLVDGVPMAFTDWAWRLNFSGDAPVTVKHRGQVRKSYGTLVPMTPEQMADAIRKSVDNGGPAQRIGIRTARGCRASAEDIAGDGDRIVGDQIRLHTLAMNDRSRHEAAPLDDPARHIGGRPTRVDPPPVSSGALKQFQSPTDRVLHLLLQADKE